MSTRRVTAAPEPPALVRPKARRSKLVPIQAVFAGRLVAEAGGTFLDIALSNCGPIALRQSPLGRTTRGPQPDNGLTESGRSRVVTIDDETVSVP